MKGEQGINKTGYILRIVGVPLDKGPDQSGTVQNEVLACRRRAELVSGSPVRNGIVIVPLLVIILIIREVLDALCAVSAILSLGECVCAR